MPDEARPRRHWSDTAFAVAALFVSAVSLWVGIRTENANEQLVAASTWPYLLVESSNATPEGARLIHMDVTNSGVGPAKVESFELFWKGKAWPSANKLVVACCGYRPFDFAREIGKPARATMLQGGVRARSSAPARRAISSLCCWRPTMPRSGAA